MNVQIIVISANEERKQYMMKQFKELSVPYPVFFLEASTPATSKDYFLGTNYDSKNQKNYCCSKSHCRAIEYAGLDTSPEYSIIVEDDVALHKTKFLPVVEELRLGWRKIIPNNVDYISLGWIMMNTHEDYLKRCKPLNLSSYPESGWFDWFVIGLQAYMIKRDVASKIAPVINKPTLHDLRKSILSNNFANIKNVDECEATDVFLPRILYPWAVFPSLAIESEELTSLLEHNNFTLYWNKYFSGRAEEKLLYYKPT
jgi:hypothetical protein